MSFCPIFTGLHVSSKSICFFAEFHALKTRQRVVAKPDHAQLREPFFFWETWRYSDCAHLSILRNTRKQITRHLGVLIRLTSDATIGWYKILHVFAPSHHHHSTPPPHTHPPKCGHPVKSPLLQFQKLNTLVRPSPRLSLPRGAPHSREKGASVATKNLFAAGRLTAAYSRVGDQEVEQFLSSSLLGG